MPRKTRLSVQEYVSGILDGNRIRLSQAITLIESKLPSDQAIAGEVLMACLPHTGQSRRIGITGIPGVGKSTFIDAFGSYLIDQTQEKLAVLAIDPSSRQTKGSILGDKTRMHTLSLRPEAYVRPTATGGTLGGVANKTREAMLLCEAAGYRWIFIETVGVGQSETLVADMVDAFLLLMLPNAGDELQGIKKGIMEMADFLVINKADGSYLETAKQARQAYRNALHLFPPKESGWHTYIENISALQGVGFEDLLNQLSAFFAHITQNGYLTSFRRNQRKTWFDALIVDQLYQFFMDHPSVAHLYPALQQAVLAGEMVPSHGVNKLLQAWNSSPT